MKSSNTSRSITTICVYTARWVTFAQLPSADIDQLVIDSRQLQAGDDGSHLGFVTHWYGYTRKYSPQLLEIMPFQFDQDFALRQAVTHLKDINRDQKRKLTAEAPISFLPRRWMKYVIGKDKADSSDDIPTLL